MTVVLVLIALALWLVASLANQIPGPWSRPLSALNAIGLLPQLHFFAPDPIDVDYHLVVQDVLDDGQTSAWRQISTERDGPWRVIWSTAKRDHQAMLTSVAGLAGLQQSVAPVVPDPLAVIQLSLPYLFLLHRAQAAPRLPGSRERQFMIVETKGFGISRQVALGILSNPHRLD